MIALDNEPFNVVNHTGFTRLMKLVEPCYKLPSDKYFSDTLIPEIFQKVCLKVQDALTSVSLTTDIWRSVAQDSYISLTCHYITPAFDQQQVCLHAAPFNNHHTGEHIGSMVIKCWSLTDKLHVVRDNGSKAKGCRYSKLWVFGHTLQLVVKDGCLAQPAVVELTAKARKLVGHNKHSNVALQCLVRIQEQLGLSPKRLIQDEPTKWNATYYMLQRLVELRVALTAAGVDLNVPVELTSSNWLLMEKVVKILQIYEEVTHEASGNYATTAVVIPVVNSIMRSLEAMQE